MIAGLSMSKDHARAAIHVIESTLEDICCCSIHKATGEGRLQPYEKQIIELLLIKWGTASKAAVEKAVRLVRKGGGPIDEGEIAALVRQVGEELNKSLVPGVKKGLGPLVKSSYWLAKSKASARLDVIASWADPDRVAVQWLTDHHIYWVGSYYDKHLSKALAKTVADGVQEGLGRDAIGQRLSDFFDNYPGVGSKPESYWRGLAANGINRSQNFGQLRAYEELEITYFEVVAVMDERTTPICRLMDGKVIPVSAAITQRNRLMAATDPEEVRDIAPWPSVESLQGLDVAQIVAQNVAMPPYHFNCRTTVVEHFEQVTVQNRKKVS